MRPLNKLQSAIFLLGAVLMVAGAAMRMLMPLAAPYVFTLGVLAYVAMQMLQRYDGDNFTIARLRRIMLMSDVLLLLTAALMFADYGNPLGLDHLTWLNYIHNNWMVVLLLAAVLQLYTVHRISSELEREAKKR